MVFRDVRPDGTTRLTGGVPESNDPWPVDSIYISMVDVNPSTHFGGTWAKIAQGRTLIGVDPAQAEFDTVGETGGVKEVTLTAAQSGVPAHNHPVSAAQSTGFVAAAGAAYGITIPNATTTGNNAAADAASPHTNLPPYIAVYFWRRTA